MGHDLYESLMADTERAFPRKAFLTLDEVAELLSCSTVVVYNWTRRPDAARRPPAFVVGKKIRFPKSAFIQWLKSEQWLGEESG